MILHTQVLKTYDAYYNHVRTHLSLDKDAPNSRRPQKSAASSRSRSSVGSIINIFGFEFLTMDSVAGATRDTPLLPLDTVPPTDRNL